MDKSSDLAPRLSIAAMHAIYDAGVVAKKLEKLSREDKDNATQRMLYESMLEKGSDRFLVSPTSADCLDTMYETCLNFTPLIDELRGAILLALEGRVPVTMDPILLLGDPGVGKTHFAMMFGKLLGTGFSLVSMSQMTAGWILGGASSQWRGSRKGKIAETLIEGRYANPVVLLDEIDKAGEQRQYDPMGTLYSLLEHDTAESFVDEFVEVPIDASKILWIGTANDENCIPKPILNRMKVIKIEKPSPEHMRSIVAMVYAEILKEQHWHFTPELSNDALDAITASPPRTMKLMLMSAFRIAKLAGRDHLLPCDLECKSHGPRRIGF